MKNEKGELIFTCINFEMCNYCRHVAIWVHRDGFNSGCSLEIANGKYKDVSWLYKGCDKFEPSGLPAHPQVLEELLKMNPLAKNIPSDENATETSWEFNDKVTKYPYVEGDYTLQVKEKQGGLQV